MSLADLVSFTVSAAEVALGLAAVSAGAISVPRFLHDDLVESSVLLGLMTLGAFCLVALDAARRGAGL